MGWGDAVIGMERVAGACKTGPSTFPSDSISFLFQGFYPINQTFSAMYLTSLLYWFLPFILHSGLKFSFSPQRPSLLLPSLSTYCNVVASAHPTIHWGCSLLGHLWFSCQPFLKLSVLFTFFSLSSWDSRENSMGLLLLLSLLFLCFSAGFSVFTHSLKPLFTELMAPPYGILVTNTKRCTIIWLGTALGQDAWFQALFVPLNLAFLCH